jgi:hypothetical protein
MESSAPKPAPAKVPNLLTHALFPRFCLLSSVLSLSLSLCLCFPSHPQLRSREPNRTEPSRPLPCLLAAGQLPLPILLALLFASLLFSSLRCAYLTLHIVTCFGSCRVVTNTEHLRHVASDSKLTFYMLCYVIQTGDRHQAFLRSCRR